MGSAGPALLVLTGGLLLATLASGGDDRARRIKSAISHRCVLECTWVKERCADGGMTETRCRAQMHTCGRGCMDPKAVEAATESGIPSRWGESKQDAIEVCLPSGEHAFLEDLRCPDGKAPSFKRAGSVGPRSPMTDDMDLRPSLLDPTHRLKPGEVDYHVIDRYEVACTGTTRTLYFDMYHCGTPKPWKAPAGFTRPPRG